MRISIWQLLKNIKSFCEAKCWQHACHITWDNVHDLYGAYSLIENPFKSTSSNHLPNAQWEQSNNGRSRSDSSIDWVGQKAIMAQIFILRVAQGTKGGNAWWVARIEVNDKNPCCHPQPTRGYLHWPHLKVPGNVAVGSGGYEEQGFMIKKWWKYKNSSLKIFTSDGLKCCSPLVTSWHFSYSPHPHTPKTQTLNPVRLGALYSCQPLSMLTH